MCFAVSRNRQLSRQNSTEVAARHARTLERIQKHNTKQVEQMKFTRRLQQAIDEGAGLLVLRCAVAQALDAGCDKTSLHSATFRKGMAMLQQLEKQQMESGLPLDAVKPSQSEAQFHRGTKYPRLISSVWMLAQSVIAPPAQQNKRPHRVTRCATAPVKLAGLETVEEPTRSKPKARSPRLARQCSDRRLQDLSRPVLGRGASVDSLAPNREDLESNAHHASAAFGEVEAVLPKQQDVRLEIAQAQLDAAISSKDPDALNCALTSARGMKMLIGLSQEAETLLAEILKEQRRVREQLTVALRELNATVVATSLGVEDMENAMKIVEDLVAAARACKIPNTEIGAHEDAMGEARAQWYRRYLESVIEEAGVVDLHVAPLEVLSPLRQKLFQAVELASKYGMSQSELGIAEGLRRKFHQAVQDRKGLVRLYCRVRPLSHNEESAKQDSVVNVRDTMTLEVEQAPATWRSFEFDACWMPGSQEDVFEDTRDLVQSAVDGYNATVFAYGQTGAGKTYTMYGGNCQDSQGLCPRAADELFAIISRKQDRYEFTVTLTMMELYCKRVYDLLDTGSKKNLRLRTFQDGEVYVENVCEQTVQSSADVKRLVDLGSKARHCRDTQMNACSSRSHLLVTLKVESQNRENGQLLAGKLLLVDLAGSERVSRSGVTGDGLREACEINASLSALGDVLAALMHGDSHIPYRNHELTQLMQDSLGGTAKTLMFVNISPAADNLEETLSALKFAQRSRGVVNDATTPRTPKSPRGTPRSARTSLCSSGGSGRTGVSIGFEYTKVGTPCSFLLPPSTVAPFPSLFSSSQPSSQQSPASSAKSPRTNPKLPQPKSKQPSTNPKSPPTRCRSPPMLAKSPPKGAVSPPTCAKSPPQTQRSPPSSAKSPPARAKSPPSKSSEISSTSSSSASSSKTGSGSRRTGSPSATPVSSTRTISTSISKLSLALSGAPCRVGSFSTPSLPLAAKTSRSSTGQKVPLRDDAGGPVAKPVILCSGQGYGVALWASDANSSTSSNIK